jgi:hypothetical protein
MEIIIMFDIQNYQMIYRKVVKQAKRKEADRFIQTARTRVKPYGNS